MDSIIIKSLFIYAQVPKQNAVYELSKLKTHANLVRRLFALLINLFIIYHVVGQLELANGQASVSDNCCIMSMSIHNVQKSRDDFLLHSNIHGNLGKMTADQIVQCGRAVHLNFLRVCVPFHRQKRNVQSSPKFQK